MAHSLDFVEVYNEAFLIAMELFDTFSAEDCFVVAAVEMLDTVGVLQAELLVHAFLIFIIKVKLAL